MKTWQQFWISIGIGLVLYYGYILITFYRQELLGWVRGKKGNTAIDESKARVGEETEVGEVNHPGIRPGEEMARGGDRRRC